METVKIKHKQGVKNIGVKTKDKIDTYIKLAADINKGKNVPLIKITNVKYLIKGLKIKGLTKKERETVLSAILFNNEKRLAEIKNKNIDKKNDISKQKILQKSLKHNASGDFKFKPKWTDAQIKAQKNKWVAAKNKAAKAQGDYDAGEIKYNAVIKEYNDCKANKWCLVKNRKSAYNKQLSIYANKNTWSTTILPNLKKAVSPLKAASDAEYVKYQAMLAENKDEKASQLALWQEQRNREEEKRKQEEHEAELRQQGIEENVLELKLAQQAAEVIKVKKETETIGKEETKTFGTQSPQTDNKNMMIYAGIGGFVLLTGIILLTVKRH